MLMKEVRDVDAYYCVHCDEEIDELEAALHIFLVRGTPIYFHKKCCPIILNGNECKSTHL